MQYNVIDVLTGEIVHTRLCLEEANILASEYTLAGREIIVCVYQS